MELRVLVMGLSGLVGDMVDAAVQEQPGLLLIHAPDAADIRDAIRQIDPHVVVVGTSDTVAVPSWLPSLRARMGLRVIALDPRRGIGVLYELRPHTVTLGDVSPADIVTLIQAPPYDPGSPLNPSED